MYMAGVTGVTPAIHMAGVTPLQPPWHSDLMWELVHGPTLGPVGYRGGRGQGQEGGNEQGPQVRLLPSVRTSAQRSVFWRRLMDGSQPLDTLTHYHYYSPYPLVCEMIYYHPVMIYYHNRTEGDTRVHGNDGGTVLLRTEREQTVCCIRNEGTGMTGPH